MCFKFLVTVRSWSFLRSFLMRVHCNAAIFLPSLASNEQAVARLLKGNAGYKPTNGNEARDQVQYLPF
jgi:hypothetical protein